MAFTPSMRRNTRTSRSRSISFPNVSGALRTRISLWSLRFNLSKVVGTVLWVLQGVNDQIAVRSTASLFKESQTLLGEEESDSSGQRYPLGLARHMSQSLPAPGLLGRFDPFTA